jgi:hypothetical protein
MDKSNSSLPKPRPVAAVATTKVQEAIRRRAEEIYIRSGRAHGRDIQNWTQAEAEIINELAEGVGRRTAIVVNVDGVQYIGEYTIDKANGYNPGEIGEGVEVSVRFEGNKMFVTRPDGRELETTIVRKS